MLKLVYHTAAFGPINLEYEKDVVRVGSSEDNDLVLAHPSIRPHHCLLSFRGENLSVLPPDGANATFESVPSEFDGAVYGLGDQLRLGELLFTLGHSAKTVALPEAMSHPAPGPGSLEESEDLPAGPRFFCAHCGTFLSDAEVKQIGLVGHAKHFLCPRCSSHVVKEAVEDERSGFLVWLRGVWQWIVRLYTTPPPRQPESRRGHGPGKPPHTHS